MSDFVFFPIFLILIYSGYVLAHARGHSVQAYAFLLMIFSVFMLLLWYAPWFLIGLGMPSAWIPGALAFKEFLNALVKLLYFPKSSVVDALAGIIWMFLFPINLVIQVTSTKIGRFLGLSKALTIIYWIVALYVTVQGFVVAGMSALAGLLPPSAMLLMYRGTEEVPDV
jgi:hypothetical protein